MCVRFVVVAADMFHHHTWLGGGGSDSDSDDGLDDEYGMMYHSWMEDSSGSGSDDENYEERAALQAVWDADDDAEEAEWGIDGWFSGGSDDESPFDAGVVNEEVPIFSVAAAGRRFGSGGDHCKPCLTLYFVGEVFSDGGSSSSAAAAVTVVHTSVSYHALPQEVVEAVLLWLPATAQARCQAVCKAWLALLSSPEFRRRSFEASLEGIMTPPVCAVRYSDGRYVPPEHHLYKSLKVDLSFLPEVFHSTSTELHSCSPSGLVCLGCGVEQGMLVCVLNPVNQTFKVLPLLHRDSGNAVLIAETTNPTDFIPSFKVYVSETVGDTKEVAIYSTDTGEWKGYQCPDDNHEMPDDDDDESRNLPLACNGVIYTLVSSSRPRLVRLNTDGGEQYSPRYLWDVTLPYFEKHRDGEWTKECFLADYRGRLLCCCGGIWMLDDVKQEWIPIAERCPPEVLPPCNPRKKHTMTLKKVQVAGDIIVFFHQLEIRRGRAGTYEDCPVGFDMLRKCWRKVPKGMAKLGDLFQAMPNLKF